VTAIQEGLKLIILLFDNHGFASIGALSELLGDGGFGTRYRARGADGQLSGEVLAVDFLQNAQSLGARARRVENRADLAPALAWAKAQDRTAVLVIPCARESNVPGYGWWD